MDKFTVLPLPRRGWPGSSFLLVFKIKLWQFNIQCLTKTKIKYLKHFITIELLEKADFLGIFDK